MRSLRPLVISLAACLLLLSAGCSGGSSSGGAGVAAASALTSASSAAPTTSSAPAAPIVSAAAPSPAPATPLTAPASLAGLNRGQRWTKSQPMFVSGLSVSLGAPTRGEVDRYFDAFHANAAHLWADALPAEVDGWRAAGRTDLRWVSWVQSAGVSQANGLLLGGYAPNAPGRIGYQIGDEPRSLAELQALDLGLQRVRAADPDALLIVNLTYLAPDIDGQLDYVVNQMDADVISYDDYRQTWRTYENLERFRRAGLLAGKPYWRYLYSFVAARGVPQPADMRWNAFVGLTYGYTGHTWFLYNADPVHGLDPVLFTQVGSLATPTPQFREAAAINQELETLGRSITQLTSTDVRYNPQLSLLQPNRTRPWTRGAGGDAYLSDVASSASDLLLGFFRDERGDTYLMAQNVNHPGGTFPANNTARTTLTLRFDFTGAPASVERTQVQTLNRATGAIETLPLRATGPDQSALTLPLAAGEPVLIKYATGRPFALR